MKLQSIQRERETKTEHDENRTKLASRTAMNNIWEDFDESERERIILMCDWLVCRVDEVVGSIKQTGQHGDSANVELRIVKNKRNGG